MGSQFVPSSPQVTAQMMAGPQAMQQISELMAAASNAGQPPGQSAQAGESSQSSGSESSAEGQTAQTSSSSQGGNTRSGSESENAERQEGELQASNQGRDGTDNRAPDGQAADVAARQYEQPPWFARLPAELRDAMQVEMQRRPPRAYEERLRRYFQSID